MKSSSILITACLVSGITSAAVTSLLGPKGASVTAGESLVPDTGAGLAREVRSLQAGQEKLARTLDELSMKIGAASGGRVSMGDVKAAVREYMEGTEGALAEGEVAPEATTAAAAFDKDAAVARLLADDLSDEDRQRLWNQLAAEGHTDEIVAAFEARVEADPTDPDKRVDLGHVYLQKIQEVGNGPLAGVLATKADEAFDAALDLDESHWDARFSKAVALSFWPPVFGKQNAAIQQFEVLAQNQATMPMDPNHAQTHLLLGNMYQQIGEHDKALAAWQAGSTMFPDHQGLLQQLSLSQDH